jgi:hypothetical protein
MPSWKVTVLDAPILRSQKIEKDTKLTLLQAFRKFLISRYYF